MLLNRLVERKPGPRSRTTTTITRRTLIDDDEPSTNRNIGDRNFARNVVIAPLRPSVFLLVAGLLCLLTIGGGRFAAEAASNQGCLLDVALCDADEQCVKDGLFGQCYATGSEDAIPPILMERPMTDRQRALLRLELERLADEGYDWRHDRAQCVLTYFKISIAYELNYDTEFCSVRNPGNILNLLQRIQAYLSTQEEEADAKEQQQEADAAAASRQLERALLAAAGGAPAPLLLRDASAAIARDAADAPPVITVDEDADAAAASTRDFAASDALADSAPIEEALIVDERTGAAVPVVLVNEELVEELLRDATTGNGNDEIVLDDDAMDAMAADAPIIFVDEDDQFDGKRNASAGKGALAQRLGLLTEAGMPAEGEAQEKDKRANLNDDAARAQLATPRPQNQEDEEEEEDSPKLTKEEDKQLNEYITDILNNHHTKIHELSTPQLEKLIAFIGSLEETLEETELKTDDTDVDDDGKQQQVNAELEEAIPQTSMNNEQQLLLKKDAEKFNYDDMGLSNIEHKIVKGDVHRVEGNRVYIKIGKDSITEDELYKLITYLDKRIAEPNNLYFNEFQYENGQLSFHVARLDALRPRNDKRVDSASQVAQVVYKRRKDIQTLADVTVEETGIGSGQDVVPVESSRRDWLFLPILTVCAFTITSLVVVLAIHLIRNRRRSAAGYKGNLPEILDHLDGKTVTTYEELCRQRMGSSSGAGVPSEHALGAVGKSGSTSSWPDESLLQSCNLDISTGHVILSFLQEYLDNPAKIADQWSTVADYENRNADTTLGERPENRAKNVDQSVVPYDETVVVLGGSGPSANTYINASKIHDSSDPRQVAYIATQTPLENTIVDFWHCVWEQGITLIVNLCDQEDSLKYPKYWPDEGARTYGIFEIYLVSEHIWNEDYIVRSFYLKNTETNETRTVTQFHYLAWPENGIPSSTKTLLEFRRKINKSYRGRASPILVHCSNGSGRTGTYCLIDVVVNRITKAGIKELNIDGSLEFLRDARPKMVSTLDQYKLVFTCVADEVSALLRNLQQQQQ